MPAAPQPEPPKEPEKHQRSNNKRLNFFAGVAGAVRNLLNKHWSHVIRSSHTAGKVSKRPILIKDEQRLQRNRQRTKRVHFRLPKPKSAKVLHPIEHDSPWVQRWMYAMVRPDALCWCCMMKLQLVICSFLTLYHHRLCLWHMRSGPSLSASRSVCAPSCALKLPSLLADLRCGDDLASGHY